MNKNIFVTAINCMDGRVQLPVINWMKNRYDADYVDMITEPGPNKILDEQVHIDLVEGMKKKLEISVIRHGSNVVALVGHYDCAGNPVGKKLKLKQIRSAMKTVKSWQFNIEVIGLWVDEHRRVFRVEEE